MFQNHLQRIPHRIKKVSCRYVKYFSKKLGTKGFLVCALYIRFGIFVNVWTMEKFTNVLNDMCV